MTFGMMITEPSSLSHFPRYQSCIPTLLQANSKEEEREEPTGSSRSHSSRSMDPSIATLSSMMHSFPLLLAYRDPCFPNLFPGSVRPDEVIIKHCFQIWCVCCGLEFRNEEPPTYYLVLVGKRSWEDETAGAKPTILVYFCFLSQLKYLSMVYANCRYF